MKQLIIAFLMLTGLAFSQYKYEKSITFLDSVLVTDSILVQPGSYLTTLRTGDLNKIGTFAFQYKIDGTWYNLAVAGGSAAYTVAVRDNCIIALDQTIFGRIWDPANDGKSIYLRLDPNDSDTTSRTVTLGFESLEGR